MVVGLKYSEEVEKLLSPLNCYYLWDNDKDGKAKSLEYLLEGKNVFNWKKFLKHESFECKDINEYVLNKGIDSLKFLDLKEYFTNKALDKFWFV